MSNPEPLKGVFYDGITGETIERELTADEIALLQKPADEVPPTGI
jgi:hypothetical protein